MSMSFSRGVTGQRTSVLNLELISFLNSLSDVTGNVFFNRGQNGAEDFLWSDWRAELFLVNSWMTRSLLLSDLNTELFLMSGWLLLSILNTKFSLVNGWVTRLLLLSSLITVLSLVNSWVTWVTELLGQRSYVHDRLQGLPGWWWQPNGFPFPFDTGRDDDLRRGCET